MKKLLDNKYISLVLLILWSCLIFFLSNQTSDVSSFESSYLISKTLKVNNHMLNIIHEPMREFMHFFEFLVFGLLFMNAIKNYKIKKSIIIAISISFVFSILDEIHQIFIPGRAFEYLDILLDMIGSIIGIYIIKIVYKNKIL